MLMMDFHQGDSITLSGRINQSIANWEIRCQMMDNFGNSIRKASSNVIGGSEQQVEYIDETAGRFKVYFQPNETIHLNGDVNVQIKVRDNDDQETTIYNEYLSIGKATGITWEELSNFTYKVPNINLSMTSATVENVEGVGVSSTAGLIPLFIQPEDDEFIKLDYVVSDNATSINFNIQEPTILHNSFIGTPATADISMNSLDSIVTPVVLIEISAETNLSTDINNVIVSAGAVYTDNVNSAILDVPETIILQGEGVSVQEHDIYLTAKVLTPYDGIPFGVILYPGILDSNVNTLAATVIID